MRVDGVFTVTRRVTYKVDCAVQKVEKVVECGKSVHSCDHKSG